MMVSYEKDLGDLIDIDDAFLTNCRYLNLDEDVQAAGKILGNSMKVAHLNIHSIPNKMEDLADLLDILKDRQLLPDILLLCETFLNEKNYMKINFPNFHLVSNHRKVKSRGGVAILIGNHIRYQEREDLNVFYEGKFESIFIEVPRKNKSNYIIGELYIECQEQTKQNS